MSELVIRAPLARLLVPATRASLTVEPHPAAERAPVSEGVGAVRPWRLPEQDDTSDGRTSMGRGAGWFMTSG